MTRIFCAAREGGTRDFSLNTNNSNDTNVPCWRGKGLEDTGFFLNTNYSNDTNLLRCAGRGCEHEIIL